MSTGEATRRIPPIIRKAGWKEVVCRGWSKPAPAHPCRVPPPQPRRTRMSTAASASHT